jgi:quinol-cytochrome oxidoreductase complex cytochrome b subunit
MSTKDIKFASSVSKLLSHFPEEWQDYQDWLRDIIASRQMLQANHPNWRATLLFYWRLVYFVAYVSSMIAIHRLYGFWRYGRMAGLQEAGGEDHSRNWYFFILRRFATLLAVAELTLCGIAALTGIMLAFYYEPTAMGAHRSLVAIATQISHGTLILSLHDIAGNGLIILALVQLVVMFLGRQFLLSWLVAWMSGLLLTVSAIGLSWTAILLNWDQIGFWRFKIELGTLAAIPLVGAKLREILTGGAGISSLTLQHMYTLHSYVLAIAAILLSVTHLTGLIFQEQTWKPGDSLFKHYGAGPNDDDMRPSLAEKDVSLT